LKTTQSGSVPPKNELWSSKHKNGHNAPETVESVFNNIKLEKLKQRPRNSQK
jgi:hypothetical protein